MEIEPTLAFFAVKVQFQIRDQFFDSSVQTTQGVLLDFFVKPRNMLIWLVAAKKVFSRGV